jgi:predicted nucleotidyltransferase
MLTDDPIVARTIATLEKFEPKSIFVYGSRGRGDARTDSDYEVGVIFDEDKYVRRSDIHAAIIDKQVKAYPFRWDELLHGTFSHVFQKSIYLREIIKGGRTVAGDHLIEQIPPLPITTLDLVQDIRFYIGRALDAMLVLREGHNDLAIDMYSKSCFFGLRDFIILEFKTFPLGYEEIYELASEHIAESEYREVIEAARQVRINNTLPNMNILFQNISLLDSYIEPKVLASFNKDGNKTLI